MSVWNDALIRQLISLWGDRLSASDCARELGHGISRNAVCAKIMRLRDAGLIVGERPQIAARRGVSHTPPRKPRIVFTGPAPEPRLLANGAPCGLMDLDFGDCRWPIGEPQAADFHFCATPACEGEPYCAFHRSIAWQPNSTFRQREKSDKPFQHNASPTRRRVVNKGE